MKIARGISLAVTFIVAFFVNIGWFLDPCARHVCPDTYGTTPLIAFQPNFHLSQRCGGIAGNCIPAHWSFSVLIFDIVLMIILNLILFFIINRISNKTKSQNI